MTLEPTTVRNYDLGQWASTGGGSFQEGSLQVLYNGMDMELGGAVKMINAKKSLILDEELSEPGMDFASTRLEGVWWMPSRKAELRLALSNVTKSYLTVIVTVEQNDARTLVLNPHETRIVNLSHGEGNFGGVKLRQFGGISISHLGFKGALLARGFVTDANVGYSQVVEFKDPSRAKSSSLNGAGLRLGTLYGKALHPVAIARNTGSAPTIVSGRIRYTAGDGTSSVVNLPQVNLEAGETKTIDVESAANSIGSLQNLVAGLEFDYTTAPGSVSIAAESYSADDNQVYRVSIVDAQAEMSSTGKYPWNLNNGSSTVVYIKNVTDQEQQYYLYANYKGGFWIQGIKTIAPHQTVALDMRQIKEQQIKDEKGNTLPADAMEGQIFWSGRGKQNLVLIGRVEQIEAGGGMSFTTACGTCCFPEYVSAVLTFGSSEGVVGDTTQFYAYEQESDCYGCYYPSLTPASGSISWTSSDITIATVDSTGLATAVGAGTATITATWNGDNWQYNQLGDCDPDTGYCGGYNGGGNGDGSGPEGECQYQPLGASATASYSVQVPTAFIPLSVSSTDLGCSISPNYTSGYGAKVLYQVVDQVGNPIHRAGMTPQEHVSVNGYYDRTTYDPFATPESTTDNGQFSDKPIGTCFLSNPFSTLNQCVNVHQNFNIIVPGLPQSPIGISTYVDRRDCEFGISISITNPSGTNNYSLGTPN